MAGTGGVSKHFVIFLFSLSGVVNLSHTCTFREKGTASVVTRRRSAPSTHLSISIEVHLEERCLKLPGCGIITVDSVEWLLLVKPCAFIGSWVTALFGALDSLDLQTVCAESFHIIVVICE